MLLNHWLTLRCPQPVPSSLGDFQACPLQARCASTGCECLPGEQVGGNYSSRSRPWLEAKGTILSSCQELKTSVFFLSLLFQRERAVIQGWSKSLGPCGRCWRVLEVLKPHPSQLPPHSIDIPSVVNICCVHMPRRSFFFGEENQFSFGEPHPPTIPYIPSSLQALGWLPSLPPLPKGGPCPCAHQTLLRTLGLSGSQYQQ